MKPWRALCPQLSKTCVPQEEIYLIFHTLFTFCNSGTPFHFSQLTELLAKVISHSAESSEHRSLPTKWGLSILLCLKGLLYHHKSEEPVSFIQKQLQQRTVVSWLTDLITQKIWRKKKKAVLASKAFPETPETGKLQDLVYETSRAEWRKYWRNAAQVKDHRIIES